MKTLRQLSKYTLLKSLTIFFIFFSSVIAEDEAIDIWKIEKKEKINDNNKEIEDISDTDSNLKIINTSDQYNQIISNTSLEDKDLIVGLYDPSDNGLKLDMWMQSDGNEIKKLINKINSLDLSNDANQILDIALLTYSEIPNKNINEDEFVNFKIDYLIKKNNKKLIVDYLEKNKSNIYNIKLIKHYVNEYLIENEIKRSCELINKVDILSQNSEVSLIRQIWQDTFLSSYRLTYFSDLIIFSITSKKKSPQV